MNEYSHVNGSLNNFVHSSDGLSPGPQKMEVESQLCVQICHSIFCILSVRDKGSLGF